MRFFLILVFFICRFAFATCAGDFSTAHGFYVTGNKEAALNLLLCLQSEYPNDLDVKELLSNIYWQRSDEDYFRSTVREILNSPQYHLLQGNNLFRMKRRSSSLLWSFSGISQFLDYSREYDLEASGALNFFTWQIGSAYEKRSRSYKNPSKHMSGELLKVFSSNKIYSQFYLDTSFSWRLGSADFLPHYIISLIPHYTIQDSDYSLELKYSHFLESEVLTIVPAFSLLFLDDLKGSVFAYFAFAKKESFSLRTSLDYSFKSTEWILDLSAGRSAEDKGERDFFRTISLQGKYVLNPSLRVGVVGSFYDSQLREEKSIGLSLEGAL